MDNNIEGPYRKCCEITLKVLQDQTPTLMSVLRPFVYDPLVGWSRQSKSDGRSERTDAQAMKNVQHIEERLKGYVRWKAYKLTCWFLENGFIFVVFEYNF